ncbi:hypothetical protein MNEG_12271 [Monoraphidium neglectum]|uniref:Protochlorophyllide reductase n=1 Tax=Monoraphidium neglectum TaxID=145388 RepID=A0A0D2MLJ7_9CHLO|nr:hypothetical protein MNEG_12271 [Monoraphidium neglectum]KIY95690.1 hypothetical protein MNEG_12271 [Monoraphidium neglectum]|eukprot:XP_013894710.1 hypothetical protein MNEG_12271 [Monoraphidium neglectum]
MFSVKGGTASSPMTGLPGYILGSAGPSGFGASSTADQSARVLASRGAEVIIAARDPAKAAAAAGKIKAQHPSATVSTLQLDLSSLESVKAAAEQYVAGGKPLHVLMLNAGVMACPYGLTKDGHETQFGTNHLGHFALVHRLQGVLEATARSSGEPGRVVVLASSAHFGPYMPEGVRSEETIDSKEGYSPWGAYGQSKLCNVLFARNPSHL